MPPSDAGFLVGAELVEFDRNHLPIYAAEPASLWANAGCDGAAPHGASLDRLFGEPGDIHVASVMADAPSAVEAALALPVDDPLIAMLGLSDGLILPMGGGHELIASLDDHTGVTLQATGHLPDPSFALCDFGAESHALLPLTDGWYWDLDKAGWVVDHHA
jgi:hypothetical protein